MNETKNFGWKELASILAILVSAISAFFTYQSNQDKLNLEEKISILEIELETRKTDLEEQRDALTNEIETRKTDLEEQRFVLTDEIEKLKLGLTEKQIALAQSEFEENQRARKEKILETWIPLLISSDDDSSKAALAVIFSLFPEEADKILENIISSLELEEEEPLFLSNALGQAVELSDAQGDWIVVIQTLKKFDGTNEWVIKAQEAGYSTIIYKFKEGYAVSVGPFPTRQDASSAILSIRVNISPGAYPLDLQEACPEPNVLEDYTVCN